jgi:hypothetical protein
MRQELRGLSSVSMASCEEVYKVELFGGYDESPLANKRAVLLKREILQIASKDLAHFTKCSVFTSDDALPASRSSRRRSDGGGATSS